MKTLLFAFLFLFLIFGCTPKSQDSATVVLEIESIEDGYPLSEKQEGDVVAHLGYHLSYNENYEQANWVCYILTKQKLDNPKVKRSDRFVSDRNVVTGSATKKDYKRSGFDRGHLAPAADMKWSKQAMKESFFMSNMSPQKPHFNRGIWKELESAVRGWALKNDSIFVVTGPVFSDNMETIGKNGVAVPPYYYKVIFDFSRNGGYKTIAFLLPNQKSEKEIWDYAITVDELEEKMNFDFFSKLPSPEMEKLESKLELEKWK